MFAMLFGGMKRWKFYLVVFSRFHTVSLDIDVARNNHLWWSEMPVLGIIDFPLFDGSTLA